MCIVNYGIKRLDIVNICLDPALSGEIAMLVSRYNIGCDYSPEKQGWIVLSTPSGSGDVFNFCARANQDIQIALNGNSDKLIGFVRRGNV